MGKKSCTHAKGRGNPLSAIIIEQRESNKMFKQEQREKKDLQEISEQPDTSMKIMLVVVKFMANTIKDQSKQVVNTTGMRLKNPLVVDLYTVNTTKDLTKQVLNIIGMKKKATNLLEV